MVLQTQNMYYPNKHMDGWQLLKHPGIQLWKGNFTHLFKLFPQSISRTFLFDRFKKWLSVPAEGMHGGRIAAAMLASTSTLVLLYPLDHIRTMLTASVTPIGSQAIYRGPWDCLRTTISRDGVLSLYRGMGISLLGIAGCMGTSLAVYEGIPKRTLYSPYINLLPAVGVTVFAQSLFYPIDTIRRRLQLNGTMGCVNRYTGSLDCFTKMMAEEGWKSLYKGAGINAIRVASLALLQLQVYIWLS